MLERDRIRRRKEAGVSWPWTKDVVLEHYHFCNVFREDDRVSKFWARTARTDVHPRILVTNTVLFRLFNSIETWVWLDPSWKRFNAHSLFGRLNSNSRPEKLFRSAYMVTGSTGKGQPKHVSVVEACALLHRNFDSVAQALRTGKLQEITEALADYPMLGLFMGYEVACDLEMVGAIDAYDTLSWANMGPGAKRGLNRVFERELNAPVSIAQGLQEMRELFERACRMKSMKFHRPLNMRAIEHSLCEYDKYCRAWENPEKARLRLYK